MWGQDKIKTRPVTRRVERRNKAISTPITMNRTICPKCGSRMVLRSGRYGRFGGCSRYPYCRGTRHF